MTQEENEEFNRIEMESRIRQEYVREMKKKWLVKCSICDEPDCTHQVQFMSMPMMDYIDLTQKLALARIHIKELEERLSELEWKR